MPDITSLFQGSDAVNRNLFNQKISDVNAHGNDTTRHVTEKEREVWNKKANGNNAVWVATDTKADMGIDWTRVLVTIPNFNFIEGCQVTFKIPMTSSDYGTQDGFRIKINNSEKEYVVRTVNQKWLDKEFYTSQSLMTVTLSSEPPTLGWGSNEVFTGTAFFMEAGGDKIAYNVFCQPTEPTSKDGVWLKTSSAITPKKIVFDDNVWAASGWMNPSPASPMIEKRIRFCSAIYNGKIYAFGGLNTPNGAPLLSAEVYNPISNISSPIASMNHVRCKAACAEYNGEIFIFGGVDASTSLYTAIAYNPVANTYRNLANLPQGRWDSTAMVYKNEIFIFGGCLLTVIAYNPVTNTYRSVANIPTAAYNLTGGMIGGYAYLLGLNTDGVSYKYNFEADIYSSLSHAPSSNCRSDSPSVVIGSRIYSLRGVYRGPGYTSDIAIYDTATDSYSITADSGVRRGYSEAAHIGDKIYMLGGAYGDTYYNNIETVSLTAKQYLYSPSFLFYTINKDTTFSAKVLISKLIDALPIYFKDAMLFKDGDITFPALYLGDGTQWTLVRAAQ